MCKINLVVRRKCNITRGVDTVYVSYQKDNFFEGEGGIKLR